MARTSLAEQFTTKFAKNLEARCKKQALRMLYNTAADLVSMYKECKDYHDVTGNMLNSFAVGVYYDGKLTYIVDAQDVARDEPMRKTLAAGEKYDLPYYYDGEEVEKDLPSGSKAKPYVGEYGKGGQDGRMAARRSLAQRHPKSRYALIAVVAVQYAKYVQNKKNHDVLTSMRELLPGTFEGNIETI